LLQATPADIGIKTWPVGILAETEHHGTGRGRNGVGRSRKLRDGAAGGAQWCNDKSPG